MINFLGKENMTWWQGVVENTHDPEKLGRVQVRLFGIHTENKDLIPTENLPWAAPVMPVTSACLNGVGTSPTGVLEGAWVMGFSLDGDLYQDLIVWGTIPGIQPVQTTTFDLSGFVGELYPTNSQLMYGSGIPFESEVNRLARGEKIDETIVSQKLATLTNFEVPTPAAPEYTFNKVKFTRSGHITEIDDTEGAERLHFYHKSGSFTEFHPNGILNKRTVNDDVEIIEGDFDLHVLKDHNITVEGNVNIIVGGNLVWTITGTFDVNGGVNNTHIAPQIHMNP
jgi:hypothetical protein